MGKMEVIQIINCHAAGEVGDVVIGGLSPPFGKSLQEQSRTIATAPIRDFLMNEPRGGVFRHKNILVPPQDPSADFGFLIIEPEDTPAMSGSNCICVATTLLELGMHPMTEPVTRLRLESPAGVIDVKAECQAGKVRSVRFKNVPAYVGKCGQHLEVEGYGTLVVDTAFGGDSFVIVQADQLGLKLEPDQARLLAELGARITAAANQQLEFVNPNFAQPEFSLCQFTEPVRVENGTKVGRQCVAIRPGKLDRSPCGTGCSARMAVMHAKGELAKDESFVGESILGSRFHCRVVAEVTESIGSESRIAVVPEISGSAWITGKQELWIDPSDPFPSGYRLSDTWPDMDYPDG